MLIQSVSCIIFPLLPLLQPTCCSSAPQTQPWDLCTCILSSLTYLCNSLSHFLQILVHLPPQGSFLFPGIENRNLPSSSLLTPAPAPLTLSMLICFPGPVFCDTQSIFLTGPFHFHLTYWPLSATGQGFYLISSLPKLQAACTECLMNLHKCD